jgi:hypothetical protein
MVRGSTSGGMAILRENKYCLEVRNKATVAKVSQK